MKKKMISAILISMLLLTSCSSAEEDGEGTSGTVSYEEEGAEEETDGAVSYEDSEEETSETVEYEDEGDTKESTGAVVYWAVGEESSETEEESTEEIQEEEEETVVPAFITEDVVIADNEDCTITITDFYIDGLDDFNMTIEIENKSEDTTFAFEDNWAYLNGLETYFNFDGFVYPGKKLVTEISFDDTEPIVDALEEQGILSYSQIDLSFSYYDYDPELGVYDSGNLHYIETERIYPYGEEYAADYVYTASSNDLVLIDDEMFYMAVIGYNADLDDEGKYKDWGDYEVIVYLENRTGEEANTWVDSVSVNDYMFSRYVDLGVHELHGGSSITAINFDLEDLGEMGINRPLEQINEIKFEIEFTIDAYEDYYYEYGPFTINP